MNVAETHPDGDPTVEALHAVDRVLDERTHGDASACLSVSENPVILLLMINLVLLTLGTFMDIAPLIIITPIFLPLATDLGMDPVQFGIMLILNLGIGFATPAVGSVLFVGCAIGKVSIEQTVRTMWLFYLALLVALAAVAVLPGMSLWLPELLTR